MIRDARVLRAGFIPQEVEHRDAEVNHLSSVLKPITSGEPADTAVVTGPSGAGKTCVSKFVTERLREEALDVEATYVNCWRNHTRFRTLYQILDDIGRTIDIHRQSTPHDEFHRPPPAVQRVTNGGHPRRGRPLEDPSVIYDLHSLPQFAVICIANKEEELFSQVDDRLVSRLRSSEHVRMDKYHDEQLYDILRARVRWGLEQDAVTDDQLYCIADAAAGDARLAIGILRTAAGKADRENNEQITDEMLQEAADARAQIRQKSLDSLTPHQRIVYEIIREQGSLGASGDPRAVHRAGRRAANKTDHSNPISKMTQYNLLEAEGTSRDRKYTLITNGTSPSTS